MHSVFKTSHRGDQKQKLTLHPPPHPPPPPTNTTPDHTSCKNNYFSIYIDLEKNETDGYTCILQIAALSGINAA